MKGYKAFEKGMICRGKQYAENTVFEEEKAEICESGMHFCENPFDVLNYYPLVNDNGDLVEVAEVEAIDEAKTDDNIKFCTKKLKVGAKLSLKAFIEASVNFIFEKTKKEIKKDEVSSATSGFNSHSATSGRYSNSATSGDNSHSATSGFNSHSATLGRYSNSATSGRYSNSATSGRYSHSATSGRYSNSATSGRYSHSATSGDNSHSATSGRYSHSATSGDNSNSATLGRYSHSATSGDNSHSATSGRYSNSAALGDGSSSQVNNIHGVSIAVGYNSKAKASKGSAIVVCERGEWNGEGYPLIDIKSAIVDGENLKADTWYTLENGEFIEVDEDE